MSLALAGVYGAGVATFFTPCVLPLMPVYLAALVGAYDLTKVSRGRMLVRSALFSVGFVIVFALMGLGAGGIGAALSEHRHWAQIVGAVLMMLFGLKFLGWLRIPFLDQTVRADDRKMGLGSGWFNAFVMGIVFAAGWSPCVGPVLGSVLAYTASATSEPLMGAAYLALYGVGFATPLFLTAAFAEVGIGLLRKANQLLPKLEKGLGGVLIVAAAFLAFDGVSVLLASPSDEAPMEAAGRPVLVEFYAAKCPVCEAMTPVVDRIEAGCGDNLEVRRIDISKPENRHLAAKHKVVGVPTFAVLDGEGNEVSRLVGSHSEVALREALAVANRRCMEMDGEGLKPAIKEGEACDPLQDTITECKGG